MCNRDNKKFNEIKDGKRNFGENIEKLRLKFILDNKIIRKINNDDWKNYIPKENIELIKKVLCN